LSRALVIGGRRGIGAAVVGLLADRSFEVTYTYRTEPGDFPPPVKAIRLDLADRAAVDGFAAELESGPPWDALVQVGGTTYDALAAMLDQDRAEQAMQVNFFSFTRIARAVVRPMMRARNGRIVAVGSVIGQVASQGNAAYGATQGGVAGLCEKPRDRKREAWGDGELCGSRICRYRNDGTVRRVSGR